MLKNRLFTSVFMMLAMAGMSAAAYNGTPTAKADFATEMINNKTCYKIGSAEDLYGFAAIVNGTNGNTAGPTACGVLTADITVNENVLTSAGELNTAPAGGFIEWTPIGKPAVFSTAFRGTFYGQGHTISGLYFNNSETDYVGLFAYTSGKLTIDGVGVVDSYFRGKDYVGGLVGYHNNQSSQKLSVNNSYNTGSVNGANYVGGLVGYGAAIVSVNNSYNSGSVNGTENVGGLVGMNGDIYFSYNTGSVTGIDNVGGLEGSARSNQIIDCYNVGPVKEGDGVGNALLGEGCENVNTNMNNSFYLEGSGTDCGPSTFSKTSKEFANGYVALELHNNTAAGAGARIWGQIVGADKTPLLTGEIVFPITLDNSDNCYEISNADDLYIFAAIVNSGFKSDVCGKLTENIVVNENVLTSAGELNTAPVGGFKEWTPIGFGTNSIGQDISFRGTFHGQGHTISGLYFNDTDVEDVGLFGDVLGTVTIDSVGLVDSYLNASGSVGGLVGYAAGSLTISDSYNASSVNTPGSGFGGLVGGAGGIYYEEELIERGLLTISNSYNEGSLNGNKWGGGLVGYADVLDVSNSYNAGSIYISGSGEGAYVGGITSSVDDASTVTNSFNYGAISYPTGNSVSKDDLVAGGEGVVTVTNSFTIGESRFEDNGSTKKSEDKFSDGTVLAALSNAEGGEVWRQYSGDAYPTFVKKSGTTFEPNAEGYYEIATADDLYKFAEIVNGGNATAKAKLIADICVNACGEGESVLKADGSLNGDGSSFTPWTPIGIAGYPFIGTFDGQGHTISGLYFNAPDVPNVGLFGYVTGNGETVSISNIGIEDSYFNAQNAVSGVVGYVECVALNMKNVYNAAVVVGAYDVGGVVGFVYLEGNQTLSMSNVYNVGSINGTETTDEQAGGLVGEFMNDYETSMLTIKNSYNFGNVVGGNPLVGFVDSENENVSVTNSFYKGSSSSGDYGTVKSATDFSNGTVYAALHSAEGGEDWLQYAGDAYPTLAAKTGTGAPAPMHVATLHYSETDSVAIPYTEGSAKLLPTTLSDGSIVVGWYKSDDLSGDAYTKIAVTENGDLAFYAKVMKLDSDGYYEVADADMLFKFAELVNTQNSTYRSAKVKLTADIVVNEHVLATASGTSNVNANGAYIGDDSDFRVWTPIGGYTGNSQMLFEGTFDGQGHTISGLYLNKGTVKDNEISALFGIVGGDEVSIKNVGIEDSYFAAQRYVGGIVGWSVADMLKIENCYNDATLYGIYGIAGLVGEINSNNRSLTIENSYNSGTIKYDLSSGGSPSATGALVGYAGGHANVINSYYLVQEGVVSEFGSAASSDAFANGTVATLLHGDGVDANSLWGQNVTGGESHPTFFKGINVEVGPGVIYNGSFSSITVTLHYSEDDADTSKFEHVVGISEKLPATDKNGNFVLGWYKNATFADEKYAEVSYTENADLDFYAKIMKVVDGCYQIADAEMLFEFAAIVNGGESSACGKLTENIKVNENVLATAGGVSNVDATTGAYTGADSASFIEWTPIGYCDENLNCLPFTGIFDGQGHTISGLYYNDENANDVGLFGYVEGDGSTIIKNVGVEDSYFKALNIAGGILGEYGGENAASIENVYNAAVVVAGEDAWFGIGGVVGTAWYGDLTVTNAYNVGSVIGGSFMGGIVGYIEECSATIKNSFNYGNVAGDEPLVGFVDGDENVSVTNSYYLGDAAQGDYGTVKSSTEFANGTVFAALRGADESGSWYQYQGDAYPSLSTKSGTPIHAVTLAFSETDVQYIPYVQGVAKSLPTEDKDGNAIIGWTASADGSGDVITEIPASATTDLKLYPKFNSFEPNADGYYEIASADDLYKFAEIVNGGNFTAKAKLMNDIKVNDYVLATEGGVSNVDADGNYIGSTTGLREWTPIGNNSNPFKGSFDGQGYTISGLYSNGTSETAGLFGYVDETSDLEQAEVSIQNIGVKDSYFKAKIVNGKATYAGGVLAYAGENGSANFKNVYSSAVAVAPCAGGVVGYFYGNDLSMTNVFNSGDIFGTIHGSGLVGAIYSENQAVIENSYNYGTFKEGDGALIGFWNGGPLPSVTNSYYLASKQVGDYGDFKSVDDFANGTVLAALRAGEGGYVWVQTQGDKYPTIDINATNAKTIVLDWTSAADSTTLADKGYTDGAMVIVKDGKKFYADGAIYEGILSAAQVAEIGSSTLYPISGVELETVGDKLVATLDGDSNEPLLIPTDIEVGKVVYNRELTVGDFKTVTLPFEVSDLKTSSLTNYAFYKFSSMEENQGGYRYMAMVYRVGKLSANKPYIMKNIGESTSNGIVFEGPLTLKATSGVALKSSATSKDGVTWSMTGVYEYKQWQADDPEIGRAYLFAAQKQDGYKIGEFAKLGAGAYLQPMRMYLLRELPASAKRPGMSRMANINGTPETIGVKIVDEELDESVEETTVVKHITVVPMASQANRWFDMKGRTLNGKPTAKGTYYHNGQRIIIK